MSGNVKGFNALPPPNDRSEWGVEPFWRSPFCCPHEKSTCIWSNVQNQTALCAFSVGVCSATSTFFSAPHGDQTGQAITSKYSNTEHSHDQPPLVTLSGGYDSRVPGVTLRIQLVKDSEQICYPRLPICFLALFLKERKSRKLLTKCMIRKADFRNY